MSDAPPNDWIPVQYADARNWGPWIFHGEKAKRPAHILIDTTRETAPDTVIYLTKNGHGWGVNFSPSWDEITWYRLRRDHSYYRSWFSTDRIEALEAENKRLREALGFIVKRHDEMVFFDSKTRTLKLCLKDIVTAARAALAQKGGE